ncbi:polysaccharide biosynthesis protein GtrA [Actibacterium mucosum KCTC 23349]|uniref:Polysaccharide biosynthesis protein GtrA n=1 Tax=Actibacterium mucosum KCTC 23349 TaxID=1454373 RepID=A0A037ZEU1_9RHOB|nr:GtrA family protein [Actibacterium mucosum]KAJ54133.1 polysaccharide biosynthesis protein GtrA [Actibacterium mucosum KCTC 23349]
MSPAALILRYGAFAVLATVANLGAQRAVLAISDGTLGFAIAVFTGTAVGLVLKYVLDKRWIFDDRSTGMAAHGRKFGLYTAMGLITTAIFWGTETAFWLIWDSHAMRELGAVLGLAVGYVTKYFLDRRFVFAAPAQVAP